MPIETVAAPATSLGNTLLQSLLRRARLRIEATATAKTVVGRQTPAHEPAEEHSITIEVRIYNIGPPATVTKTALIAAPGIWHRATARYKLVARADERVSRIVGGGPHGMRMQTDRYLPAHIPSGDFHMFEFFTREVWPPSKLADTRLAVWHAYSRRPVLLRIDPPTIERWEPDEYGGLRRL